MITITLEETIKLLTVSDYIRLGDELIEDYMLDPSDRSSVFLSFVTDGRRITFSRADNDIVEAFGTGVRLSPEHTASPIEVGVYIRLPVTEAIQSMREEESEE